MAKTQTLAEALVKLRSELTNPPRNDSNPFFSSKYCKLESAISHIQTPLANSDLTFIQNIVQEDKTVMAQTILIHVSGEERTINGPKVLLEKPGAQAVGGAATYAKRYSLFSALGVEADEDDDGNTAEIANAQEKQKKEAEKPDELPPVPDGLSIADDAEAAPKKAPPKTAKRMTIDAFVKRIEIGQSSVQGAIAFLKSKNLKATEKHMAQLVAAEEKFKAEAAEEKSKAEKGADNDNS